MTLHLYKLTSGETVIAEFVRQEVVNETINTKVHVVKNPKIVGKNWMQLDPWFPGCLNVEQLIPLTSVQVIAIGESIDPVLTECYQESVVA